MFRDLILKNLGWKILSLGLAVAIWWGIRPSIDDDGASVRTFSEIPIQIVSSTTDVRAFRVDPEKVSITVQGPSQMINVLTYREIRAFVDVTSADTSQNFNRPLRIATPPGITLMRVEPAEATVVVPPKSPKAATDQP
ncbi:MAG TPA: CdaR family protein [Verrucomicrobiae bacterium]|nr:CdaR family protein [Verrucomicrobiae bacterium]